MTLPKRRNAYVLTARNRKGGAHDKPWAYKRHPKHKAREREE